MATDTTVKFFHSAMVGAPVLSGTAGAMIAVLDACLVNGFGLGNADSVVIASGIATVTRSAGHSAEKDAVMLIAGATVTGGSINGEQKVLTSTSTSYTFAATGIADQTATGTISQKLAPATWAKTFAGTNLAAYKPTDVTATGAMLRVDDTSAQYVRVVGYETMSDINTGTGPFPTTAQQSGGDYWPKSNAASSASRNWILFADAKMFYIALEYHISYIGAYDTYGFGDVIPTKTNDAFCCTIVGETGNTSGSQAGSSSAMTYSSTPVAPGNFMPRSYTGIGSSVTMLRSAGSFIPVAGHSGNLNNTTPFPNPTDGGLYVTNIYATEFTNYTLRGTYPGALFCPMKVPTATFATRDTVSGITGLAGKTLKVVTGYTGSQANANPLFFDITGPWR